MVKQIASVQLQLNKENTSYNEILANINQNVSLWESNLVISLGEENKFFNNIETVNGNINISWISLWDILEKFSLIPMWFNITAVVILTLFVMKKKNILPIIRLT